MKKVLFVIHFPVFGGPHNQAVELHSHLASRGFETLVVLPDEPGSARERLERAGVPVRTMPLHRVRASMDPRHAVATVLHAPAEVAQLRRLIREERVSIVQIGGLVNPHSGIAARLEGVPVVWQLLDTRAPRAVAAVAMRWVDRLADVVMSTGSGVAQAHPGYGRIKQRMVPFFPPVDLQRFAPNPGIGQGMRASWGAAPGDVVIGCVANINPQKGIIDLVRAFARARDRSNQAKLVLVGAEYSTHASYSAAVRQQLAESGLIEQRDVVFVGESTQPERQLAGMDVFALAATPRSEGITTAVLEAMSVGLPAIVTDVGALREAVIDGTTGFVVPPGDTVAFESALTKLIDRGELRTEMGRHGRHVAEKQFGVERCADVHVEAYERALGMRARVRRAAAPPQPARPPSKVVDGLRLFADESAARAHEHEHDHEHKSAQAAHYDAADDEFETVRPHQQPRLYRFLLGEKFRRAVQPIEDRLVGASALVVCGGSGMDAEYLRRAGAAVVTSDLSIGAATRAKVRSDRFALGISSIVADIEDLPYADRSFDLVAVHDGLHHLEDPFLGLTEMTRVSRRWIMVTEPAQAILTRLAIRLGWALEREAAGNVVVRFGLDQISERLEAEGFAVIRAQRYAMYYPHRPGALFDFLSRPGLYSITREAWRAADAAFGRFGNKLVIVGERVED